MEENMSQPGGLPPAQPSPAPAAPPVIRTQPTITIARSGGTGWKVFAFVLLAFLVVSMLYNLGSCASRMTVKHGGMVSTAGPRIDEVLVEDNEGASKVALIRLEGIITSRNGDGGFSMVEVIKAQLKAAADDPRVKAVVLKVDSPGGEVLPSDEIYRLIAEFQKRSRKPVVASMGSLAASGGYYVSAPCRWIVAHEMTITGSIGVIMSTWNYRGLMDKVGVRPLVFKSGKFKDMLSGSKELAEITDEEKAMIQGLIDETYTKFKDGVAQGREWAAAENHKGKLKNKELLKDWKDYADGRVFSGVEALRLGFVDEVGNFADAVARAQALAGVQGADLIEYQQRFDFSDFFRLLGKSEAPAVKVDLGMEAPKLRPGCPYFLYTLQY